MEQIENIQEIRRNEIANDQPQGGWRGPFENPNWEAEHDAALRWHRDKTGPEPEDYVLPYRVPKRSWLLHTEEGEMRVDLVYWYDSGGTNYRAVAEDGGTLENFNTLEEAKRVVELCVAAGRLWDLRHAQGTSE